MSRVIKNSPPNSTTPHSIADVEGTIFGWRQENALQIAASKQLLTAALRYAARGWPALPLVPARCNGDGGKTPLVKGGAYAATTDETQIRAWWSRWPVANVGISCGPTSGLAIVDLDFKPDKGKNGPAAFAALEAKHGPMPMGPRVRRGDSRHVYVGNHDRLRNAVDVLPGIDVRAAGGYVVAPPSFHPLGGRYEWVSDTELMEIPPAPDWLIDALTVRTKLPPRRRPVRPADQPVHPSMAEVESCALSDRMNAARGQVTIDDVLGEEDLPATPSPCPLHQGDDDNFKSYADGQRWHCHSRCPSGENDGDIFDLIQRLAGCNLYEAIDIAEAIAARGV